MGRQCQQDTRPEAQDIAKVGKKPLRDAGAPQDGDGKHKGNSSHGAEQGQQVGAALLQIEADMQEKVPRAGEAQDKRITAAWMRSQYVVITETPNGTPAELRMAARLRLWPMMLNRI